MFGVILKKILAEYLDFMILYYFNDETMGMKKVILGSQPSGKAKESIGKIENKGGSLKSTPETKNENRKG